MELSISFGKKVVPIQKKIKNRIPLCDGLYPHEILVIEYATYYNNKDRSFPQFWKYYYGINNLPEILNSLVERHYLELGNIKDAIKATTIPVIKKELKIRGLKISGKKDELINRLIDHVSEEELSKSFQKRPYKQTALGKRTVLKYEWVLYIHKNFKEEIDIWDFAELLANYELEDYRKLIWIYLKKRCDYLLKIKDYGIYRNTVLRMSNYAEEIGNHQNAFDYLCIVTAYDLTHSGNNYKLDYFMICLNYNLIFECKSNSITRLSRGSIDKFKYYLKLFNWSESKLHDELREHIDNTALHIRLFTPEECADIVIAEINEDEEKIKKIYSKAKRRFKKEYKKYFDEIKDLNKISLEDLLKNM